MDCGMGQPKLYGVQRIIFLHSHIFDRGCPAAWDTQDCLDACHDGCNLVIFLVYILMKDGKQLILKKHMALIMVFINILS